MNEKTKSLIEQKFSPEFIEVLKNERGENWREEIRKSMPGKARTDTPRTMPIELDALYRAQNKEEVSSGFTVEMAAIEARRCLDCPEPTCMTGCPVSIHIPKFIKHIEKNDILGAAAVLKETSALPAVCGRVCPQEKQCEASCFYTLKLKKNPVSIGMLERFASDYERNSGVASIPSVINDPITSKIKVAAVGSGPAGMTWALDMRKLGYDVTVFEALHEIGGVLKYGIPEFRLPNSIVDFEIAVLEKMGVKFIKNFIVGKTKTIDQLRVDGFKAFFVATGAGLPNFMNIKGENYNGIFSSNEYLTRVNLMGAGQPGYDTPVISGETVVVVGGGNTAMDSVRTAKRLGAKRAIIVYRRSEEEMPARGEEIHHAKEEGVEFLCMHNPVEYLADSRGNVTQIRLQKMELTEADSSGRRRPVPIEGSEFLIKVNAVIVAVGVSPNPILPNTVKGLETTKHGTIVANPQTLQSSISDIFAGGDIVRGGATVILAMGDGKKAAVNMHQYLKENVHGVIHA